MTDRELLELAAKAAGIVCYRSDDGLLLRSGEYWNPLTGDGDALRLAVKLGLSVSACGTFVAVRPQIKDEPFEGAQFNEDANDDIFAATRRAIVRAAAEIGKAMPA